MRQLWVVIIILVFTLLTPASVMAQGQTPPVDPFQICVEEGFGLICLRAVGNAWGLPGILILLLIFLLWLLIFTPTAKLIQDRIEEWLTSLPIVRKNPLPAAEIQRLTADYLQELEQSPTLKSPDEMAARLDTYLATLRNRENPLKPSEEKVYIPLEGGLDISPRIGLFQSGQASEHLSLWVRIKSRLGRVEPVEPSQMFAEQHVFENLSDALDAIDEATRAPYPVLALLGEPGAGKSTLLRKFTRDMIVKRIQDPSERLPFFVSLSAHKSGSPLTFLRAEWKRLLGFDGLDEALAEGRVWLFADGLNEMPRPGYDTRMAQWRAFLREHFLPQGNRALVTCRVADYGEGIGAPRLVIHRMDEDHIRDFLQKRIPERADTLWRALERDRDDERGAIYALAQVPFWLVMLTRLSGKGGLPRNRASLLDEFIKAWLDYENNRPGGRVLNDIQRQSFMDAMTDLAWAGLSRSQNYTFPMPEVSRILRSRQSVVRVDDLFGLGLDCNLLSMEGDTLRFQHQLLQEFFAARELARQFMAGKNLRDKWRTPWRRWKFVRSRWDALPDPPQTNWEEALILAAGLLDPSQAESLALVIARGNRPLAARCALEAGMPISEKAQDTIRRGLLSDLQGWRVRTPARLSAGRALAKMGDPRFTAKTLEFLGQDGETLKCIEPEWVDVPAGTFTMGLSLAELPFMVLERFNVEQNELPPRKVFTSAFQMARYPVTVAEYRCFMEAGGYANDSYWQAPGALRWRNAPLPYEESYVAAYIKALRENQKQLLVQIDDQVRRGAWSPEQAESVQEDMQKSDEDLKQQFQRWETQKRNDIGQVVRPWRWNDNEFIVANQPVVGVSWYEACAYAAWLTETLQAQNRLLPDWEVRLPTEAEWEKAARGGRQGLLWTWGSLWKNDHANTLEGRVMKPTPVGAYPRGVNRYGLHDLHGNVWEWCGDWYASDTYKTQFGQDVRDPQGPGDGSMRVLRGGSWYSDRDLARCAYRYRLVPDNFDNSIGFRLVRSPSGTSEL